MLVELLYLVVDSRFLLLSKLLQVKGHIILPFIMPSGMKFMMMLFCSKAEWVS